MYAACSFMYVDALLFEVVVEFVVMRPCVCVCVCELIDVRICENI